MDMFKEFLVKAKVATYASNGEGNERKLKDGGKELIYEDGGLRYRDVYYGSKKFSGQEIVWKDGNIFWSMNYYGGVISDEVPSWKIYKFLKKAMKLVEKDRPYRGPSKLKDGNFKYSDKSKGNVEKFFGEEKVFFNGSEVYRLKYFGGMIKK